MPAETCCQDLAWFAMVRGYLSPSRLGGRVWNQPRITRKTRKGKRPGFFPFPSGPCVPWFRAPFNRVDQHFTIDEVVFGEPGDMTLLGARTLEGLSLVVAPRKKKPVAAGPLPVA